MNWNTKQGRMTCCQCRTHSRRVARTARSLPLTATPRMRHCLSVVLTITQQSDSLIATMKILQQTDALTDQRRVVATWHADHILPLAWLAPLKTVAVFGSFANRDVSNVNIVQPSTNQSKGKKAIGLKDDLPTDGKYFNPFRPRGMDADRRAAVARAVVPDPFSNPCICASVHTACDCHRLLLPAVPGVHVPDIPADHRGQDESCTL